MAIKMKNVEAFAHLDALQKLKDIETPLPTLIGYRILQNLHALEDATRPYIEMRDEIIKKYSKDGRSVDAKTDPEGFNACMAEMADLDFLDISVEIHKISVKKIEKLDLPMSALFALDFMLEDG